MRQKKLILASGSPRRKQLLEAIGIPFTVQTADTPENYPEAMAVMDIPVYIATNKARAVATQITDSRDSATNDHIDTIILAADTIVAIDNKILGKPSGPDEAKYFLKMLSGKTHQVITGVCLYYEGTPHGFAIKTDVHFTTLTNDQISYYVDHFAPMDKAGAYGIQEWIGMIGIDKINGDYYNVVGLPVCAVKKALHPLGL